ncbi:hypothetical protein OF83DRAFT_1178946 [Amylostereum chailletii]|nr:hypothetical protein OF83DRAFT_1178946 [Amylostereum chailletii]
MISTGTLNLRFMQNAQRVQDKGEAAVASTEAGPSLVSQDESRWEVSTEVRKAWGISSQASASRSGVAQETSYLPFLFSSADASTSVPKLRGRRTWNKKGEETVVDESLKPEDTQTPPSAAATSLKRLTSISGSGTQYAPQPKKDIRAAAPDTRRSKARTGANGKTAMQAIREDVIVGTDLRPVPIPFSRSPVQSSSPPPRKDSFLKPAGVDDPTQISKDVLEGARAKRNRDNAAENTNVEEKKRKKKKKVAVVEE